MHLVSRTRQLTGPQGLPKVYFTCHPADRERYLPDVTAMLLRQKNCSLWYDDGPAEDFDEAEFTNVLADMRLAVVPVTRRLLTEPNRAADRELALILASRIPLLPLMEEPDLLAAYTARFGNAQFLAPSLQETAALSFEEKLTLFLDHALPDDALDGRIRAAFEGSIFISYRKKDRWLMRPLLPLIHSRPRYQALSFWYDEYLVPGEDFSDNIQKALAESSLVLLAVTDSVLEPGNYVLTAEYPDARRAGKPILPVELAATDRTALAAAYPDLPPLVAKDDAEALFAALDRALEAAGVQPRPMTPERDYLIGMAYLTGIGVEPDRDRGLARIAAAAQAGHTEAAIRLRDMYLHNNYVEQDFLQAFRWAVEAQAQLVERFAQELTEASCADLMYASRSLGDVSRQLYDTMPESRQAAVLDRQFVLENALRGYEVAEDTARQLAELTGSGEAERIRAIALSRLGSLLASTDPDRATRCRQQAEEVFAARYRRLGTAQAAWDLAMARNERAYAFARSGTADGSRTAIELYKQSLAILEPWRETGTPGVDRCLAITHVLLGEGLFHTGGAGRPLTVTQALLGEGPDSPGADVRRQAREHLQAGVQLLARLQDDGSGQVQTNVSAYLQMGQALLQALDRREGVRQDLAQLMYQVLCHTLALSETSSGPGDSQINAYVYLITACRAAGDRAQAESSCRDCWQMLRGWLPVTPTQPVLRGLADCCLALARAHLEAGDFQEAADRCEEGLALLDGILDEWPAGGLALPAEELFALQRELYGVSARLDRQLDMQAEAQADELMRQAAEHCLAGRLDLACSAYETAYRLLLGPYQAGPTVWLLRALVSCARRIAVLQCGVGDGQSALALCNEAVDLLMNIDGLTKTRLLPWLERLYAAAAAAADRAGDGEAARDRLAWRSLAAQSLYNQTNTVADLRRLAEALLALGAACSGPKQTEFLAEAVRMWTTLSQRYPSSEYFAGRLRRTQTLLEQAQQDPS